ncbi:MAG: conjugal transfer protein [Streptococcaceae bacterium]|jgi:ribosomal protein L20A (L18A)|nr:conjugal transfer protein [Streptococcaceae bacterium]
MLKVKVIGIPVFHNGKRYVKNDELEIEDTQANESLFEVLEKIEDDPFKGVRVDSIVKVLKAAEVEIPESADRDALIQLMKDNGLTL